MWPHKITTKAIMNIKVLRNLFFTFVLMNINIVHFINGSSLDSPHLGFNKRGKSLFSNHLNSYRSIVNTAFYLN